MFINKPGVVMEWAKSPDRKYLVDMRVGSSSTLYANRFAVPTDDQYDEAGEFLQEITGLVFDKEQVRGLLALYPQTRIRIVMDGVYDTRDDLSFAAAHFILGCNWPTYGDKVDIDEFVDLLQQQGAELGFLKAVEA